MKGDFTRTTFDPALCYTGVRLQQGRVQLDADWNEQVDIAAERVRAGARDMIGAAGGPLPTPGFEIVTDPSTLPAAVVADLTARGLLPLAPGNVLVMPGRYYVDGVLVDNPAITTLMAQPEGGGTALAEGRHLLYLDVWEQHLTFVEAESIREVALGGPDTATRTRQVWQVRAMPVNDAFHCLSTDNATWDALVAGSTGRMTARAEPAATSSDPCVVPASAGFRGLQNRLYRVEIHTGGALGTATMKWSRDNGTVLFPIEEVNVNGSALRVRLRSLGRDDELSLQVGDYVEVLDDDNELTGTPGLLTQVAEVDEDDRIVTLGAAVAGIDTLRHAKLRRWDSAGAILVGPRRWITVEDGIEVQFEAGSYRTGDYWEIPARTILGNPLLVDSNGIEWPQDAGAPAPQGPQGIRHRYARLAIVRRTAAITTREHDCRVAFPALTELRQLDYVSGDGQEVMPDLTAPAARVALAEPLVVGVSNGRWPVAGARVRFRLAADSMAGELVAPAGAIPDLASPQTASERTLLTAADGTAACAWRLSGNPATPVQQVETTLLDAGGSAVHLPVVFTANLSIADRVAYDPGNCRSLAAVRTVQDAINALATLVQLHYAGGDGQETTIGQPMALPLQVRVANACGPIAGARVRFEASDFGRLAATLAELSPTSGAGSNPFMATTDADGLAMAYWLPGANGPTAQTVRAVLDAGGRRVGAFSNIEFNGRMTPVSQGAEPGVEVRRIRLGVPRQDLVLDAVVTPAVLAAGIEVEASGPIDVSSLRVNGPQQAVMTVSVGLPYPITNDDQFVWTNNDIRMPVVGFTTLHLAATVNVDNNSLYWMPTQEVQAWMRGLLFPTLRRTERGINRLLVRLTLHGNFLLARSASELRLDGEVFRTRGAPGYTLPSGNGRRGGDLEVWFWLAEAAGGVPPIVLPVDDVVVGPRNPGSPVLPVNPVNPVTPLNPVTPVLPVSPTGLTRGIEVPTPVVTTTVAKKAPTKKAVPKKAAAKTTATAKTVAKNPTRGGGT